MARQYGKYPPTAVPVSSTPSALRPVAPDGCAGSSLAAARRTPCMPGRRRHLAELTHPRLSFVLVRVGVGDLRKVHAQDLGKHHDFMHPRPDSLIFSLGVSHPTLARGPPAQIRASTASALGSCLGYGRQRALKGMGKRNENSDIQAWSCQDRKHMVLIFLWH